MKKKNVFWLIISLALALRLFFFVSYNSDLFWDEYVYIGMGRYIFSLGEIGIWEFIRPLFLPILLGSLWWLGFPLVVSGIALSIGASIGIIFLTYMITAKLRNESEALIASIIVAFTPIFFQYSFRILTEIYALLFSLLAIYFFISKGFVKSGIFAGLAFMAKFPAGLVAFFLILLSLNNRKKFYKVFLPFFCISGFYLFLNKLLYKDAFIPLITGNYIIKNSGLWIFSEPWYFYIIEFFYQNPLYLFSIFGLLLIIKKSQRLIPIIGFAFFIYFSTLVHKEARFMVMFLPYFAILAAFGIKTFFKSKHIYLIVFLISISVFTINFPQIEVHRELDYLEHSIPDHVNGQILVSHPGVSFNSFNFVKPLYLPIYNSELSSYWYDYIKNNSQNISYVFLDTCDGLICDPLDIGCKNNRDSTIIFLESNFDRVFYEKKENNCQYYVFKNSLN